MVKGQWMNLYDGGINYGAPAHGGEVKVVNTMTKQDGKDVSFAHIEIIHMRDEGGTVRNSISIPSTQLEPLINELLKIAGLEAERDREARIASTVETGDFKIFPYNNKWITEDSHDIALGTSPKEAIAEFFKIKDEKDDESSES